MTTLAQIAQTRRTLNAESRIRLGVTTTRPAPHYAAPLAWLTLPLGAK